MPDPQPIKVTTSTNWNKLDEELRGFPKQLRQAQYQAVKRTADQGKKIIFDRFKEQYPKVQKSKITGEGRRRPIRSKVSGGEVPEGTIIVTEQGIPIIAFGPTGPGSKIPSLGKSGGVTFNLQHPQTFRHAFKAVMRSGHVGIFFRKGAADTLGSVRLNKRGYAERLPIKEAFGPSIYSLMNVPKVNEEVMSRLDELLSKNVENQIARAPLLRKQA